MIDQFAIKTFISVNCQCIASWYTNFKNLKSRIRYKTLNRVLSLTLWTFLTVLGYMEYQGNYLNQTNGAVNKTSYYIPAAIESDNY